MYLNLNFLFAFILLFAITNADLLLYPRDSTYNSSLIHFDVKRCLYSGTRKTMMDLHEVEFESRMCYVSAIIKYEFNDDIFCCYEDLLHFTDGSGPPGLEGIMNITGNPEIRFWGHITMNYDPVIPYNPHMHYIYYQIYELVTLDIYPSNYICSDTALIYTGGVSGSYNFDITKSSCGSFQSYKNYRIVITGDFDDYATFIEFRFAAEF